MLAWKTPALATRDFQQIALLLTGHARALAADVEHHAQQLPENNGRRALADVVLDDAHQLLAKPLEGTVRSVKDRAQLVRALYGRLDRLTQSDPADPVTP